ncbi:hypothetical protein Hanom_Chr09g00846921 [Helianthus anomalus]
MVTRIKRLVFGCSRCGKEGEWSNHAEGDKGGPPKVSEVRIKMLRSSICHVDILCCNLIPTDG